MTRELGPEERERFDEEIGMREDPAAVAREQLAAYQRAAGITFADPDAPAAAAGADSGLPAWATEDTSYG